MFGHLKNDLPASIVVFLVAMPLCLGIALASGAPLFSGLIAGAVGGIIVGSLSGSSLGVSGPAAGLAVIVASAIQDLGSFEVFLVAVIFAGILQIAMGFLKAGIISHYFPNAVINGMLAGIGVIIFLKQIPHAVGYDADYEGDLNFIQLDHENTFSELGKAMDFLSPGPMIICAVSLGILILWEMVLMKKHKIFTLIQGPLVAVVAGVILNKIFEGMGSLALIQEQVVNIPISQSISELKANITFPNFKGLSNPDIYVVGVVLAIVGSLETLLCVDASDKQDPEKRVTPTNRELKAQGVGNIVSGLIGGLPITQVIIRSSTNVQAGGKTKLSAIIHGFIIVLTVLTIPGILNMIPLATLAAILFVVGFKLAKPSLFKKTYAQGIGQFIPFITTILGLVFTDLLTGVCLGFAVAVFFILKNNYRIPIIVDEEIKKEGHIYIELSEDVSFLKKASLKKLLNGIPDGREVTIDASKTYYIHQDVIDIIENFEVNAKKRNIKLNLIEVYDNKKENPTLHFRVDPKST